MTDTIAEPRAIDRHDLESSEATTWRMPTRDGENRLAVWGSQYYHRD